MASLLYDKSKMKEETILKNEWVKRYDLTAVTQSKYYKIVGCFAIGFELMKIHGKIKPYFVIYPLWLEDVKECFGFSFLYHCIEDTKGLYYSLSISKMLEKKEEIFLNAENYINFDLRKNIHKDTLLKVINAYSNERYSEPPAQYATIEMKAHMATFLNDESLFEQAIVDMEIAYAKYNSIFEKYLGKLDDWKNNLTSVFSNRQAMLDKIEENIANGKIKAQVELLP
jgi:hypothetical protein